MLIQALKRNFGANFIIKSALIILAILIGLAFVWNNGPDDEGWYMNASLKMASGQLPYRDFFFPQGPLMVYLFAPVARSANPILFGRLLSLIMGFTGLLLFCLAAYRRNRGSEMIFLLGVLGFPLGLSFLTLIKTHAPVVLLLGAGIFFWSKKDNVKAAIFFGIAATLRFSLAPFFAGFLLHNFWHRNFRGLISLVFPVLWLALWAWLSQFKIFEQLFLPFGFVDINEVSRTFSAIKGELSPVEMIIRKPVTLLRCLAGFPLLPAIFMLPEKNDEWRVPAVGSLILLFSHLLADRPYEEYQIPALYLMLFAASIRIDTYKLTSGSRFIFIILLLIMLPWARVYVWAANSSFKPYLPRLTEQQKFLDKILPAGRFYPFDAYLAIDKSRPTHQSAWLGQFSYLPDASDSFVEKFSLQNKKTFAGLLNDSEITAIYTPDESMQKNTMTELLAAHPAWERQATLPACFPETAILWLRKGKQQKGF